MEKSTVYFTDFRKNNHTSDTCAQYDFLCFSAELKFVCHNLFPLICCIVNLCTYSDSYYITEKNGLL